MRLLVTGGAGFIGSNFLEYCLLERPDWDLTVLDAHTYAADFSRVPKRYKLIRNDITLVPWEYFLSNNSFDAIINFAAETHVDNSIDSSSEFLKANYIGVQRLLEGLRALQGKHHAPPVFLQVSTDEVYGDIPVDSTYRFRTADRLAPSNPYAATKAAADLLVQAYSRTYGVTHAICRATNNYGKYQHSEKFIPTIIERAVKNESIPVYGTGENCREWLYAPDFSRGLALTLEGLVDYDQKVVNKTFNFGSEDSLTNLSVAKAVLEIMGKPDSLITFVSDRPGHDRRYSVDYVDTSHALNWAPLASFLETLPSVVAYYREKFGRK